MKERDGKSLPGGSGHHHGAGGRGHHHGPGSPCSGPRSLGTIGISGRPACLRPGTHPSQRQRREPYVGGGVSDNSSGPGCDFTTQVIGCSARVGRPLQNEHSRGVTSWRKGVGSRPRHTPYDLLLSPQSSHFLYAGGAAPGCLAAQRTHLATAAPITLSQSWAR